VIDPKKYHYNYEHVSLFLTTLYTNRSVAHWWQYGTVNLKRRLASNHPPFVNIDSVADFISYDVIADINYHNNRSCLRENYIKSLDKKAYRKRQNEL
jgi:hypothetical protein